MNYYQEIKEKLINNEIYKRVKDYSKNRSDLETYYKVGKLLSDAGKHYGEGIIRKYSIQLTSELGKKYSYRTLYKMLKFYNYCKNTKVSTVSEQLTWGHFDELLSIKNKDEIIYYINKCEHLNLSVRQLRELIKSKEYERLPEKTKH